jgi:hypothetical protein
MACNCQNTCDCENILEIPVGPAGPAGPSPNIGIGTVTSGSTASATMTGTSPNYTLNLTLPTASSVTYYYNTNINSVVLTSTITNLVTLTLPAGTYILQYTGQHNWTSGDGYVGAQYVIHNGVSAVQESGRTDWCSPKIKQKSLSSHCIITLTSTQTVAVKTAIATGSGSITGAITQSTLSAIKLA